MPRLRRPQSPPPRILVHVLELSGKDLSREKLVTTLEGLYEFETGLMPKITFGPNRRIGVLGRIHRNHRSREETLSRHRRVGFS